MAGPHTGQFKGVSYLQGSFTVQIRTPGTDNNTTLRFKDEETAARAYDELAVRTFGLPCYLNFPEEWWGCICRRDSVLALKNMAGEHFKGVPQGHKPNKSGFKGVQPSHSQAGHFNAYRTNIEGKGRSLGIYPTADEAARAYDEWATEQYGISAQLNFPGEWREGRCLRSPVVSLTVSDIWRVAIAKRPPKAGRFKNVYKLPGGTFNAKMMYKGTTYDLGCHSNKHVAAQSVDAVARILHDGRCYVNLPYEEYPWENEPIAYLA